MSGEPTRSRTGRRADTPPPTRSATDEKSVLVGFLHYLRTSIASKVEDTPEPAVRTSGVPSGTNLLGLINHLTNVERFIFLGEEVPNWAATFRAADDQTVTGVLADYRLAVEQADARISACADLDQPAREPTTKTNPPTMRWALVHMIEETGRHAGHADILRELIDGTTGR